MTRATDDQAAASARFPSVGDEDSPTLKNDLAESAFALNRSMKDCNSVAENLLCFHN